MPDDPPVQSIRLVVDRIATATAHVREVAVEHGCFAPMAADIEELMNSAALLIELITKAEDVNAGLGFWNRTRT